MKLIVNGRSYEVEVQGDAVVVDGVSYKTTVVRDGGNVTVRVGGRPYKVQVQDEKSVTVDGRPLTVEMSGRAAPARRAAPASKKGAAGTGAGGGTETGSVRAPMPGTVIAVRVKEGDRVDAGAVLLTLEAMKMQNEIKSLQGGVVKRIAVAAGQTVNKGDVMVVVE